MKIFSNTTNSPLLGGIHSLKLNLITSFSKRIKKKPQFLGFVIREIWEEEILDSMKLQLTHEQTTNLEYNTINIILIPFVNNNHNLGDNKLHSRSS